MFQALSEECIFRHCRSLGYRVGVLWIPGFFEVRVQFLRWGYT